MFYITGGPLYVTERKFHITGHKLYVAGPKFYITVNPLYVTEMEVLHHGTKLYVPERKIYTPEPKNHIVGGPLYATENQPYFSFFTKFKTAHSLLSLFSINFNPNPTPLAFISTTSVSKNPLITKFPPISSELK